MSAGLEPGQLNPLAVEAMMEAGLDISASATKGVFDIFRSGALFAYVIAVCDAEAAQRCPTFPGITRTLVWSFLRPRIVRRAMGGAAGEDPRASRGHSGQGRKFINDHDEGKLGGLDFSAKPD